MKFAAFVAVASASDSICPSNFDGTDALSGCYVQSETWEPNKPVTCSMDNTACLGVVCGVGSIDAFMRSDLFQTNQHHDGTIMDQIQAGTRKLYINDALVDPDDADCGLSFEDDGIRINWNYAACAVSPTMGKNDDDEDIIVYSLSVSSPGNSGEENDTIEFYIDTSVAASCSYDPVFDIEAEGFHVNQENVEAAGADMADLSSLFSCKFFSDAARNNELGDSSIVNMGSTIFGSAVSQPNLGGYGLQFKMTRVTFCDAANGDDKCFRVVEGGHGADIVEAAVQTPRWADVGESIPFRFNSFGFENNADQNMMSISCRIRLDVENGARLAEPALDGYGGTDY